MSEAKNNGQQLPVAGNKDTYQCLFCRKGIYEVICNSIDYNDSRNQGYTEGNITQHPTVFLECPECGNCQRFKLKKAEKWFPDEYDKIRPYLPGN